MSAFCSSSTAISCTASLIRNSASASPCGGHDRGRGRRDPQPLPSFPVADGIQVELGDAYGGERRRLVFSLHVPHIAALGPAKAAELVLRYVSVGDEIAQHEVKIPVAVNLVSADEAAAAAPDLAVRDEVLVLRAAQARDEAIRRADERDYAGADGVLAAAATELRAGGRADEAAALDDLRSAAAPTTYDAASRKRMHFESNLRRRRRIR